MRTTKTWGFDITRVEWEKRIVKSQILECKYGHKYIYIQKHKGQCYICTNRMSGYCKD